MNETQCRQADFWDWTAQIITIIVKTDLKNRLQAEQEKPIEEQNLGLQILIGAVGIPVCDAITYELNKDLCVPIVKS